MEKAELGAPHIIATSLDEPVGDSEDENSLSDFGVEEMKEAMDESIGGLEQLAIELIPTKPNRFDPYEALEIIDRMNLVANVQNACTVIHEQVGLLRAYITGMER